MKVARVGRVQAKDMVALLPAAGGLGGESEVLVLTVGTGRGWFKGMGVMKGDICGTTTVLSNIIAILSSKRLLQARLNSHWPALDACAVIQARLDPLLKS
jgi:hypothetical protein